MVLSGLERLEFRVSGAGEYVCVGDGTFLPRVVWVSGFGLRGEESRNLRFDLNWTSKEGVYISVGDGADGGVPLSHSHSLSLSLSQTHTHTHTHTHTLSHVSVGDGADGGVRVEHTLAQLLGVCVCV